MRLKTLKIGMAIVATILPSLPACADAPAAPLSSQNARTTWINPRGTVKVDLGDCNGRLCGWVVWATDDAKQEARDGGTPDLIGVELLQNYRQTAPGKWTGQVFVPDWGRTFYSTIKRLSPDHLKISGCILGGWLCKSQVWIKA